MNRRKDLTSWKTIWGLAWPHSVENILFTLLLLVDLYWVGQWKGDDPISAISLVGPIIWTVQSAALFIFYGMLAMISRSVGSGDFDTAKRISHQGLVIGFVLGLIVGLGGIMLIDPILSLYSVSGHIKEMAGRYLFIMFLGIPVYYFYMALYAVFSGNSNTKDPMFLAAIAWLVNFVLDPVLILGWGIFPSMGITGAALATFIAYMAALLGFFTFFQKPVKKYVPITSISDLKPDWKIIREIFKIGAPAGLNGISRPLSATVLMGLIAFFGTEVLAAFGIVVRIISINWIYLGGLNIAVSTLVGQNLGAGSVAGAQKTVFKTWYIGIIAQLVFSGFMIIFNTELVSLFATSEKTITAASYILIAFALGTVADVFIAVYGGALNGAGDTFRAMISSVSANWIFKLPLCYGAYYFFGYGAVVIYWVVALSIPFEGLLNYFWYRRGAWKNKKFDLGIEEV